MNVTQENPVNYIEAARLNADAASKGTSVPIQVTDANGFPRSGAGVDIGRGNPLVRETQARSMVHPIASVVNPGLPQSGATERAVPQGQDVLTTQAEGAANRGNLHVADRPDTAVIVGDDLRHGEVDSPGTVHGDAAEAVTTPQWFVLEQDLRGVIREARTVGLQAAVEGGVVTAAVAGIQNTVAAIRGKKSRKDAVIDTAKDTVVSAIRSAGAITVGTMVRYSAARGGIQSLALANASTAVAAGAIDLGVTAYSLARGEISMDLAAERIGQTGAGTISGLYAGTAAGLIFGPIGAVVGSVAGYVLASNIFTSCVSVFRRARFVKAKSAPIAALGRATYPDIA